jgi:Ca2+/Na+ antiporter
VRRRRIGIVITLVIGIIGLILRLMTKASIVYKAHEQKVMDQTSMIILGTIVIVSLVLAGIIAYITRPGKKL